MATIDDDFKQFLEEEKKEEQVEQQKEFKSVKEEAEVPETPSLITEVGNQTVDVANAVGELAYRGAVGLATLLGGAAAGTAAAIKESIAPSGFMTPVDAFVHAQEAAKVQGEKANKLVKRESKSAAAAEQFLVERVVKPWHQSAENVGDITFESGGPISGAAGVTLVRGLPEAVLFTLGFRTAFPKKAGPRNNREDIDSGTPNQQRRNNEHEAPPQQDMDVVADARSSSRLDPSDARITDKLAMSEALAFAKDQLSKVQEQLNKIDPSDAIYSSLVETRMRLTNEVNNLSGQLAKAELAGLETGLTVELAPRVQLFERIAKGETSLTAIKQNTLKQTPLVRNNGELTTKYSGTHKDLTPFEAKYGRGLFLPPRFVAQSNPIVKWGHDLIDKYTKKVDDLTKNILEAPIFK